MITNLKIGEIVRINKREFLLTESAIGGSNKKKPLLILLNPLFKKTKRFSFYKRIVRRGKNGIL